MAIKPIGQAEGMKRCSEKGEATMNHLSSALDAFFGGPEAILSRITDVVRARLDGRSDLDEIEKYLGLNEGTLAEVKCGARVVTKDLFFALKAPFRLSLDDVLNNLDLASLPDNVREYWEGQRKTRPMTVVGFAGLSRAITIQQNPIDLNSYVKLRAIGEFYRM